MQTQKFKTADRLQISKSGGLGTFKYLAMTFARLAIFCQQILQKPKAMMFDWTRNALERLLIHRGDYRGSGDQQCFCMTWQGGWVFMQACIRFVANSQSASSFVSRAHVQYKLVRLAGNAD